MTTYQVQGTAGVQYGPLPEHLLNIYVPVGAPPNRKAVVMIHGGGWATEGLSNLIKYCFPQAALGRVCLTMDYRLVKNESTDYRYISPSETDYWPAQIVDVQLAIRWLRANASTYQIDPNAICAFGGSAGGHLALMAGMVRTIWPGDQAGLYADMAPYANCVVDAYGPTDLSTLSTPLIIERCEGLVDSADKAALLAASPISYVSPSMAPVSFIQGLSDTKVPPSQTLSLIALMDSMGLTDRHSYMTYNGGHGWLGLGPLAIARYIKLGVNKAYGLLQSTNDL